MIAAIIYEGKELTTKFYVSSSIEINSIALLSTMKALSSDHNKPIDYSSINEDFIKLFIVLVWKFWTCNRTGQLFDLLSETVQIPNKSSSAMKDCHAESSAKIFGDSKKELVEEWCSDEEYDESDKQRRLSPVRPTPKLIKALEDARKDALFREDKLYWSKRKNIISKNNNK